MVIEKIVFRKRYISNAKVIMHVIREWIEQCEWQFKVHVCWNFCEQSCEINCWEIMYYQSSNSFGILVESNVTTLYQQDHPSFVNFVMIGPEIMFSKFIYYDFLGEKQRIFKYEWRKGQKLFFLFTYEF